MCVNICRSVLRPSLPTYLAPVSGPALAARYLIPALVDCLGRLVNTAAASTRHAFFSDTAGTPESDVPWRKTNKSGFAAPPPSLPPPPPRLAGAAAERCPPPPQDRCGGGDPASLALLEYCLTRDATEEYPDPGVSGGTPFLVLSRALGDICVHVSVDAGKMRWCFLRLGKQEDMVSVGWYLGQGKEADTF